MAPLVILRHAFWLGSFILVCYVVPGCLSGECFATHCGQVAQKGGNWQHCLKVSHWTCDPHELCVIDFKEKDVHFHCHSKDQQDHECPANTPQDCNLHDSLNGRGASVHCKLCCETRECILNLASHSSSVPSTSTAMPSTVAHPTPASTLDPTSMKYLMKECPDLMTCDDTMCTDHLAPTFCRRHCGFCDYPSFVLESSTLASTTQPTGHVTSTVSSRATTTLLTTKAPSPSSSATTPLTSKTTSSGLQPSPTGHYACEDKYYNCSSIPFACQSVHAGAVCQKYCNLCPSTTSNAPTPVTTIQPSKTPCMDHLPASVCTDTSTSCADAITGVLCAKTCQQCQN